MLVPRHEPVPHLIHLGFAQRPGSASAMIPMVIVVLQASDARQSTSSEKDHADDKSWSASVSSWW